MKKIKPLIALMTVLLGTTIMLTGCKSIENYFVTDAPDSATVNGPLTAVEYTTKIDKTILPLMNNAEVLMSNNLEVVKGNYPVNQQIAMVEDTLNKTQTAIEEVNKINQPPKYTENKAQTIVQLNNFKDVLKRYEEALNSGDVNKINSATDLIKTARASLKTVHGVYQQ